jgi:hypothetical protein
MCRDIAPRCPDGLARRPYQEDSKEDLRVESYAEK